MFLYKETKRKMVEKLEDLVCNSCLERTGKEPNRVEVRVVSET